MKRVLLPLLLLSFPGSAEAQSNDATIARALAAAPARVRDDATVVKWNADHSYVTIKQGTNRIVCYDRSGEPGEQPFAVQCTSIANLDRLAQNRRFDAEGKDAQGVRALVEAAEANGTRIPPEYGSVWMTMGGSDQASARVHATIAVPGATAESLGLPDNGRNGGAWLMDAGKTSAHIMTPGS
jgi:hypothetical protein